MHLCFIKSDAAHAASEWQCSGHVLVHLALIHSHTAPCSDIFKWNGRPHLTRQDVPYIHNVGQCKQGSPPRHPSPLWNALFFSQTSLLFIAVWVQVMAGQGSLHFHFHSCQEMNCNSIMPHCLHGRLYVSLCSTESLFFPNQVKNQPLGWDHFSCE